MGANSVEPSAATSVSFNPRTRDGCEARRLQAKYDQLVSIHAPVMGANATLKEFIDDMYVSIHAPVMGANTLYLLVM